LSFVRNVAVPSEPRFLDVIKIVDITLPCLIRAETSRLLNIQFMNVSLAGRKTQAWYWQWLLDNDPMVICVQ
jgi:hypothetical protein